MFSKPIHDVLKSSSFRFALLTGFTIWFATSVVLIAVYVKLENTIWRSIDNNLGQHTEALLAQAMENPDINVDDLVTAFNAMSQATAKANSGTNMMDMHDSPAMKALHSSMGIVSPPNHLMDGSRSLTGDNGNLQFTREVTLPTGEIISISQNIEYLTDLQASLWQSLTFGLSITLLIAFVAALILTQRSLRRIHQINQACQTIMEGDFSHRVPYQNASNRFDDYDQMALHINGMLDEIDTLVVKVRQVSDNIAHDLKSPLARLRARLESAYEDTPSEELDNGIAEVDRLLGMIKSLLGIAHIESRRAESFERVDLQALLNDVEEMYAPVFEDSQLDFSCKSMPSFLLADKHLLFQAIANLLDNALKFTPKGGVVALTVDVDDKKNICLVVRDTGAGIEPNSLGKVFERFHREDSSRNTNGFGLGLSLVQAIVTLHKGKVVLTNDNGLVVTLTLPSD